MHVQNSIILGLIIVVEGEKSLKQVYYSVNLRKLCSSSIKKNIENSVALWHWAFDAVWVPKQYANLKWTLLGFWIIPNKLISWAAVPNIAEGDLSWTRPAEQTSFWSAKGSLMGFAAVAISLDDDKQEASVCNWWKLRLSVWLRTAACASCGPSSSHSCIHPLFPSQREPTEASYHFRWELDDFALQQFVDSKHRGTWRRSNTARISTQVSLIFTRFSLFYKAALQSVGIAQLCITRWMALWSLQTEMVSSRLKSFLKLSNIW